MCEMKPDLLKTKVSKCTGKEEARIPNVEEWFTFQLLLNLNLLSQKHGEVTAVAPNLCLRMLPRLIQRLSSYLRRMLMDGIHCFHMNRVQIRSPMGSQMTLPIGEHRITTNVLMWW